CASAALFGRFAVPAWGAYTMRAEFAVLSGVPESELGYDRFNPYYALARVPLESQVWRLRRAGYRTICLHPFDRRFFRRDLALPRSDEMLRILMDGIARRGPPAVLAFYGDHLPSLAHAFGHYGFDEWSSDYAIWPGTAAPQRRDIEAHELGRLIVDAALDRRESEAAALDLGACLALR